MSSLTTMALNEDYWNTDSLPLIKTNTSHQGEQFISSPPCIDTLPNPAYTLLRPIPKGEQSISSPSPPCIDTLPNPAYTLLRPIPIRLSCDEDGEWVASFQEAHISMSGSDPDEAKELLAEDIVSAFALFLAEEKRLSPRLTQDLTILRQYMEKG